MDFSPILHFDPQLVAELALGAEPPVTLAERYGLDIDTYDHLSVQPWFVELVARKRTEFHEDGVLFTAKAGMMAEALLTRLFQQSMAGSLAAPLMVEMAKQLSDIGRLKPSSMAAAAASGPPFQINIQVNGTDVIHSHAGVPAPAYIPEELRPAEEAATFSIPLGSPVVAGDDPSRAFDLPPPPAALKVPDFDLRPSALVGSPAAQAAASSSLAPAAAGGSPLAAPPPLDPRLGLG